MRRRRRILIRLPRLGLGLALVALAAAAPAAATVRITAVDASAYPQIQATVVGSAPSTRPPLLREGGAPVVGVDAQNLGREKAVVLAVDRSRSMAGKALADATAAARTFVRLKGRRDQVAVVAFGRTATASSSFSDVGGDSLVALGGVRVDRRQGTALYDAVVLASRRLAGQALPGRVILLLTDGHDVSSRASLDEAITAARRAHALVYPIAVEGAGFDSRPLRELASSTGGSYHPVGSSALLSQVYSSIAGELSRTWRVRYTTAARPGERVPLAASLPRLGSGKATLEVPATLGVGAVEPTPPSHLVPIGLYGPLGTLAIAGSVALVAMLAFGLLFASGRGTRLRARLDAHVAPAEPGRKRRRSARTGVVTHVLRATEQAFGNLRQFRSLQRTIERADLPLRAAEFVYIQLGCAFFLGIVFAVAGASPLVTLAALVGGGLLPRLVLARRARKRLRAFENQLPDLLITLAASLKAGHSFRHGIQTVVDEGRPPASDEFKRVLTETSLGRPMDDALKDMAERVGSKNLEFVIMSVTIQRQVGGSLAGLFDMVAEAVRQRQQFARKIRSLTAMGRMSAYVLAGLPIFLAAALTLLNRDYMSPLYHTSTGHMLMGLGVVMMLIGSALLKKIVSFRG